MFLDKNSATGSHKARMHGPGWRGACKFQRWEKVLQYTLNATSTPPRAGTTGNEDYDEVHEEEENDDDDDDVDDDDVDDDDGDDFDDDDDINSFSVSAEAWVITKKTAMNFRWAASDASSTWKMAWSF